MPAPCNFCVGLLNFFVCIFVSTVDIKKMIFVIFLLSMLNFIKVFFLFYILLFAENSCSYLFNSGHSGVIDDGRFVFR